LAGILDLNRLKTSWNRTFNALYFSNWSTDASPDIQIIDCNSEEKAFYKLKKLSNHLFDLDQSIPLLINLLKVTDELHYLVIVQHHILTDLHSKNILSKVLSDFYNNNETSFRVTEYQENMNTVPVEKQKAFWQQHISNSSDTLLLPSSRSARSDYNGEGNNIYTSIDKTGSKQLQDFALNNQLQSYLVLLVSYAVLMSKLCGQNSFFLGIPFSNRRSDERKNMYGPFINILPLHISISKEDSFLSLYQNIRTQMLQFHRNQEIPFQEIAQFYRGKRNPKVPYFLQAGFTQEDPFTLSLNGLECTPVRIRPDGAQMDLFLTYWQENEEIHFRWEYNTKAFTEDQIQVWQKSYRKILENFQQKPEMPISDVSFTDRTNNNYISRDYELSKPFRSHLIEAYGKYNNNQAIKDDSKGYSFSEFTTQVKKYSNYLFNNLGTGNKIAVVLDRSIDRIAVIHSIICSGNAYLPIDTHWPKERISYLMTNADVRLAVTDSANRDRLDNNVKTTLISELMESTPCSSFPEVKIEAEAPIAVLYTSGSTGNPKGVRISGKGITNRLQWMQEAYPIDSNDTLIHKVPYTFDVSIWETFWSFLAGARLFIPDPIRHIDDNYLSSVIRENAVTYIHFVPSLLRKFFDTTKENNFPDLKGMICSGEALDVSLVEEFYKRFPHKKIHNLYGPTEASIDVTAWTCRTSDIQEKQIPIGYPIANTRIYILNEDNLPCPPYVKGEIAIAGVNLALGYINNEEETAKHFITGDWGWGEEKVYLTGDLGFSRDDGCIEYAGRKDYQIKIHGIRIELSEIERQIEKNPLIQSAVVLFDKEKKRGRATAGLSHIFRNCKH
jgi:amino acid adenylation domain-containing protein